MPFAACTPEQLAASLRRRLEEATVPEPNSGCYLFSGHPNRPPPHDYGRLHSGARTRALAHRVAYELYVGTIPADAQVLHICDTPACVNPSHLLLGTNADNATDKAVKGRAAKKLTPADIRDIRASPESDRATGLRYGVDGALINRIRNRKLWKHIP